MKKEVVVTLAGLQMEQDGEDSIELVHVGEYYERNGTHYLLFEEFPEGTSRPVKNMIRIKDSCLRVQKKGPVTAEMVFEERKSHSAAYQTPYGSFLISTYTTKMDFRLSEEKLEAKADYELSINGEHYANCNIRIQAEPRESFRLRNTEERDTDETQIKGKK